MKTITRTLVKSLLKPRQEDSHKGNYGHALLFAGSLGKMGAAVISARACLRSGVGLLTVNVPQDERFILQTTIPEAMLVMRENPEIDLANFSALGIGPGIGTTKSSAIILTKMLTQFTKPILLDADALNIISGNKKLFKSIPKNTVLTPHPKEFDRLFGIHKTTDERMAKAVEKANELGVVIVLKGHQTLVTYSGKSFLNTTGNAGLAKGGSGDALTGIITSFLAQGYQPFEAAKVGVYIHGLAADIALKQQSMESMLVTDVIECLGKAFKYIEK